MDRRAIERGRIGVRSRCRPLAILIACAISVWLGISSTVARAAPAVEPVSLVYEAPPACPGSAELFREITRRTGRARAARDGERARTLHVTIVRIAGALIGHLRIEESGALSGAREVRGETCSEVVEALGFVAALAVDPEAQFASTSRPGVSPEASVAHAEPPVPSTAVDAVAPEAGATSDVASSGDPASVPPSSMLRTEPRDVASEHDGDSPSSRTRFSFGVQGEGAALADVVLGVRLFGDLQLDLPGRRILAPAVRLIVARTSAVAPPETNDLAELQWTQAAVEGCPLLFDLAHYVVLRPCAGVSAGVVEAESSGVRNARSRTRPWMSIEMHGRAVWSPVPALAFELEAGAVAPVVRETFVLQPTLRVYEAPAIAFVARGGVAVRFW